MFLSDNHMSYLESAAIDRIAAEYKATKEETVMEILRCSTRFRVAVKAERDKWNHEPAAPEKRDN